MFQPHYQQPTRPKKEWIINYNALLDMAALVYAYLTISSATVLQFESPYMYIKFFGNISVRLDFPSTIFE